MHAVVIHSFGPRTQVAHACEWTCALPVPKLNPYATCLLHNGLGLGEATIGFPLGGGRWNTSWALKFERSERSQGTPRPLSPARNAKQKARATQEPMWFGGTSVPKGLLGGSMGKSVLRAEDPSSMTLKNCGRDSK